MKGTPELILNPPLSHCMRAQLNISDFERSHSSDQADQVSHIVMKTKELPVTLRDKVVMRNKMDIGDTLNLLRSAVTSIME